MKTMIRKFALVLSVFVLFAASTATANDGGSSKSNIELKYIGHTDRQPMFQLDLSNAENKEYIITIKDNDNNTLYSEKVDKTVSRKFVLNADDIESGRVRLEVKERNSRNAEVFEITRSVRLVHENVVTRVK